MEKSRVIEIELIGQQSTKCLNELRIGRYDPVRTTIIPTDGDATHKRRSPGR